MSKSLILTGQTYRCTLSNSEVTRLYKSCWHGMQLQVPRAQPKSFRCSKVTNQPPRPKKHRQKRPVEGASAPVQAKPVVRAAVSTIIVKVLALDPLMANLVLGNPPPRPSPPLQGDGSSPSPAVDRNNAPPPAWNVSPPPIGE